MLQIPIIFILFLTSISVFSQEPALSIGLGTAARSQIYKAGENELRALPFISWKSKNFYFRGITLGYQIYSKYPVVNLTLNPTTIEVDNAEGTYNEAMRKRYRTLHGGIETVLPLSWANLVFHLQTDLLGIHQGWTLAMEIKRRFQLTSDWNLSPGLVIQHLSENYVEYYFGVNADEVRADRPLYRPKSEIQYGPILSSLYNFSENWSLINNFRYIKFGSEIARSPLLKRNDQFSILIGVSRSI